MISSIKGSTGAMPNNGWSAWRKDWVKVLGWAHLLNLFGYTMHFNSRICRTWLRWMGGVGVPGSMCTPGYQLVKCPLVLTGTTCNPFVEFHTPILSSILTLNGSSTVVILVPINGWFAWTRQRCLGKKSETTSTSGHENDKYLCILYFPFFFDITQNVLSVL